MGDEKVVSQMLGREMELELGDGKKYKLGQLGVTDLIYFEEKFGSINVLFDTNKPFTVILHILFCLLKKKNPNLEFKDLDNLLPFNFFQKNPEIIDLITQQLTGELPKKGSDPKNSPKPEITP